jgi:hypothetical protein
MVMSYWKRHFLGVELVLALVLTVTLGLWLHSGHSRHLVKSVMDGQRAAVYGTLAAIDGALLGFIITTAAIVLGFSSSERFELLRTAATTVRCGGLSPRPSAFLAWQLPRRWLPCLATEIAARIAYSWSSASVRPSLRACVWPGQCGRSKEPSKS